MSQCSKLLYLSYNCRLSLYRSLISIKPLPYWSQAQKRLLQWECLVEESIYLKQSKSKLVIFFSFQQNYTKSKSFFDYCFTPRLRMLVFNSFIDISPILLRSNRSKLYLAKAISCLLLCASLLQSQPYSMSYYKYHKKSSKKMRIKLLYEGHLHSLSLQEHSVQALRNLVSEHFSIKNFQLYHNGGNVIELKDKMQVVCVNKDRPKNTIKISNKQFKPQAFNFLQERKIIDSQLRSNYLLNGILRLPDQDFYLLHDCSQEIREIQEIGDDELRLNNWLWRKLRDKPYSLGSIGHSVVKLVQDLTEGAKLS